MSMTPPPGWYRDPSYPLVERWWDGTMWTDHRRQPEAAADVPPAPLVQPEPASGGGGGRAKAVALTAAGAVLVASIVTGAVVLGRGGDDDAQAKTTPATSTAASPTPTESDTEASPSADEDPTVVVDQLNGITLPVTEGWAKPKYVAEDDVVLATPDSYDCPGGSGLCWHGRVISRTATSTDEKSPRALAEHDIDDAAKDAYDRDTLGGRPYDGIASHEQVKAGSVAVAGRAGYFVRWRVRTGAGPGGYVESLAFPASTGTESLVIVRLAFDAGEDGPPVTDMDRITEGIRPVGGAGADTGGVGSSIGPSK